MNEVSGAPHAPSDAIETSSGSKNTETAGNNNSEVAPSVPPDGAPGASDDYNDEMDWPADHVEFLYNDNLEDFLEEGDPDLPIRASEEGWRRLLPWIGRKYGDEAMAKATEARHAKTLTIAIIKSFESFRRRAADVA